MAQLILDAQTAAILNDTGTNTNDAYADGINMAGQGANIPGITGYSDLAPSDKTKATDGIKSTLAGLLKRLATAPARNIVTVFDNGFTSYGDADHNAGQITYRKDVCGEVYLEGSVRVPGSYTSGVLAVFTLPAGFRPAANEGKIFATLCNDASASVQVLSSGVVAIRTGVANGWLSLDTIRFPAGS